MVRDSCQLERRFLQVNSGNVCNRMERAKVANKLHQGKGSQVVQMC